MSRRQVSGDIPGDFAGQLENIDVSTGGLSHLKLLYDDTWPCYLHAECQDMLR